jgi:ABC-type amino acid transport system permease subunit
MNPVPRLLYAAVLVAVVLQVAGIACTVLLLLGWRSRPERRPQTRAQRALRLTLPLLLNLAWGATALLGVPLLIGQPFRFGLYVAPDLFSVLLVSGSVALIWAVVRTALVWQVIRMTQSEGPVSWPIRCPR